MRPSAVGGLNRLREQPGWVATPNFHFAFMASGFCWTKTGLSVDEYVEFWVREIVDAGAVAREEWDEYWAWLVAERIAEPGDRAEFDAYLDGTGVTWRHRGRGWGWCATGRWPKRRRWIDAGLCTRRGVARLTRR